MLTACFCRKIVIQQSHLAVCLGKVNAHLQEPPEVEKKVGRIAAPYF
jgi:hypothetical protein